MNEELADMYYRLYNINSLGLRFFTVYGPWGRPDMALFSFTKSILNNDKIEVYNKGNHYRSFTYIEDIITSILLLINKYVSKIEFCEILNIGGERSIPLMEFIHTLENSLGKKAEIIYLPKQQGDVETTYSDCTKLHSTINFQPNIDIEEGIEKFVDWYKDFNNIK